VVRCVESDLASLGKVENVSSSRLYFLPCLVGDFNLSLNDDLHLMICVFVHEGGALLQAVEAAGDGFLLVDLIAAGNSESVQEAER
jgi:hypothetical protein